MAKFVYAFFKYEAGQNVVAISTEQSWKANGVLEDVADNLSLQPLLSQLSLQELEDGIFELGTSVTVFDAKEELDKHPDLFEGNEELRAFCQVEFGPEEVHKETSATVAVAEPKPVPEVQPQQQQPTAARVDMMSIQIGNHVIQIPMDVTTAMMLAQVFQTYAQYQIATGGMQPQAQPPVQQAPVQVPTAEKPKSVPQTPTTNSFVLPNTMRGEMLDVNGQFMVKIEQGGKLLAETKCCTTRDEAYDISNRFARMIPGLTKPGEINRK